MNMKIFPKALIMAGLATAANAYGTSAAYANDASTLADFQKVAKVIFAEDVSDIQNMEKTLKEMPDQLQKASAAVEKARQSSWQIGNPDVTVANKFANDSSGYLKAVNDAADAESEALRHLHELQAMQKINPARLVKAKATLEKKIDLLYREGPKNLSKFNKDPLTQIDGLDHGSFAVSEKGQKAWNSFSKKYNLGNGGLAQKLGKAAGKAFGISSVASGLLMIGTGIAAAAEAGDESGSASRLGTSIGDPQELFESPAKAEEAPAI